MSLQFDGTGSVAIPTWQTTGDFNITGSFTYVETDGIVIGNLTSTSHFLAVISGGIVRARVSGVDLPDVTGFTDGDVVVFTWSRIGTALLLAIQGKGDSTATGGVGATFILSSFGKFSSGFFYTGIISGVFSLTGAGGVRDYNFSQSPGATTLPDTTSGQDGTLSGFVTGDFITLESITITSLSDDQCRQRDGSGNATFTVSGEVSSSATSIESSIDGGITWQVLDAAPTTSYAGTLIVNGEVDISVRIGNLTATTATRYRIKAAACIAAIWQSNESGRGQNPQTISVGVGNPTPSMYKSGVFSTLADPVGSEGPAAGSMWPLIAQQFSDAGVPLCVMNSAIGGSVISSWLSGGANYATVTDFATACGGLEFTTSVGGESDSSSGLSTALMVTRLTAMTTSLNTDFGTTHYLTYFPVGTSTGTTENVNNIRTAFDEVIADNAFVKSGGDLTTIDISSATNASNDNLHLKLDEDLATGAAIRYLRLADLVGKFTGTLVDWETGAPSANLTGLKSFFSTAFGENKINTTLITFTTDGSGDFNFEAEGATPGVEYVVGLSNSAGTILEYHKLTAEAI